MSKDVLVKKINKCVLAFNTIIEKISNILLNEFPRNNEIVLYNSLSTEIIKQNKTELISVFLKNIYSNDKYRESIISGNDDFFLNNQYDDIPDKNAYVTIFQFKSCWNNMNDDLKKYIIESLKSLINISEKYIEFKSDLARIQN